MRLTALHGLFSVRVGERVWDARRRRPEVARPQLDDVIAELNGQSAVDDVEGILLSGVEVQARPGTVRNL